MVTKGIGKHGVSTASVSAEHQHICIVSAPHLPLCWSFSSFLFSQKPSLTSTSFLMLQSSFSYMKHTLLLNQTTTRFASWILHSHMLLGVTSHLSLWWHTDGHLGYAQQHLPVPDSAKAGAQRWPSTEDQGRGHQRHKRQPGIQLDIPPPLPILKKLLTTSLWQQQDVLCCGCPVQPGRKDMHLHEAPIIVIHWKQNHGW